MKKLTLPILLVTTMVVSFPASAIKQSKDFEERRAHMQTWCGENPQKCEERKARHAKRRAWCEANPAECESRRAERRQRREQMRALCESNPDECHARREEMRARRGACREDPAACPKPRSAPSAN
jgi:hypothetical protein